jgi:hypothetical protein
MPSEAIPPAPGGFLVPDPARFHDAFAADLSKSESDFMANSQVMIAAKAFDTKAKVAAWKTKPGYGVVQPRGLHLAPAEVAAVNE